MKSPVLAFLQNCWFMPDTNPEVIRMYHKDPKFRRLVLARTTTGKRLFKAFGQEIYHTIWWDNASEGVARVASGKCEADHEHMMRVIQDVQPRAIIAFGGISRDALLLMEKKHPLYRFEPWHYFPHPNARGLTQFQLNEFAKGIISKYFDLP